MELSICGMVGVRPHYCVPSSVTRMRGWPERVARVFWVSGIVCHGAFVVVTSVDTIACRSQPICLSFVKWELDRDLKPGRFLLSATGNVLLVSKVSESPAGRIEIPTLWLFSQGGVKRRGRADGSFRP